MKARDEVLSDTLGLPVGARKNKLECTVLETGKFWKVAEHLITQAQDSLNSTRYSIGGARETERFGRGTHALGWMGPMENTIIAEVTRRMRLEARSPDFDGTPALVIGGAKGRDGWLCILCRKRDIVALSPEGEVHVGRRNLTG